VCILICCAAAAQAQKNYKDAAEYGLFDAAVKDLQANSFDKAIADLDAWKQKYPDSAFKDDRQVFYALAYAGAKQPEKALSAVGLVSNPGSLDAARQVRLLYTAAVAIQQISNPTPEQLAIGGKAARELDAFDKIPEGVSPDAWASTRAQLRTAARAALLYVALVPGAQALHANDCAAASATFRKALQDFPDSAQAAAYLGEAEACRSKTAPGLAPVAIYEFARAASLDPAKGMADPKWQQQTVEPALERMYNAYHGADAEGLAQLKQEAVKSPLPPEGFIIESAAEIAQRKQADFETKNPELALWMRMKAALNMADGEQYFEQNVKNFAIPQLRGVLLEAKPACRPAEVLIGVPLPDAASPLQPEIVLKLAKPLSGKPDLNSEIRWEGVAATFTKSPFLLTMETDAAQIHGLTMAPCPRSK
jgi:outer membrane protein assembly factor BamD (BamD/ComL family)